MTEAGQVSLRGLAPLVVVEVLFGLQQRVRGGAKCTDTQPAGGRRRAAPRAGRLDPGLPGRAGVRGQAGPVTAAGAGPPGPPGPGRSRVRAGQRHLGPGACSVIRGGCRFTGITQPWLRHGRQTVGGPGTAAPPRWRRRQRPAEDQRAGAAVGEPARPPGRRARRGGAGPSDIENFLNRLAYLESTGRISRYHRNVICRGVRAALAGIRALGLTRPGLPAAGLAGDFAIGLGDIPAEPVRGEPGRDLPSEIMTVLCANLDTLAPVEVAVATQIAIDTGRRPEDILGLPLDCLDRDTDGAAVLVYDNAKAHRLGRRLPISDATAAVITGQQQRVRRTVPRTPRPTS